MFYATTNMDSSYSNHHIMAEWLISLQKREEFVIFKPRVGDGDEGCWGSITSKAFTNDLLSSAGFYRHALPAEVKTSHVTAPIIVGVWLTGRKYNDIITILGLMLSGFIPQLFSSVFPNPEVLWDLMEHSGAQALIYDDVFNNQLSSCRVPVVRAVSKSAVPSHVDFDLKQLPLANQTDIALIVHSSGTTSGMPKIIPVTHGWLASFVTVKYQATLKQGDYDECNVTNTLGNLAHVGSITAFMGAVYHGFCTVQSSSMSAPTSELVTMITTCGVNRLVLYASFLSSHIKEARRSPAVASVLASCRQILHTGVSLPREDEEWAVMNALPITAMYGCTETAPLMTSVLGSDASSSLLRMIPGVESATLIPCTPLVSAFKGEGELFEVVCYQGKKDSPHSSLFHTPDGVFHTDDIFEQVSPGLYRFRGRKGDWIKTLNGFCDAHNIEENVRQTCADLIHDAAVVGDNRPLPCLFVELPAELGSLDEDGNSVIMEIIERTKIFNMRLFTYERIEDPRRIIVLPYGDFPRTKEKGNVRRNAIAILYETQLDEIFDQT